MVNISSNSLNRIVAVEGVKHIWLKKEQRDAYKINIDAAAKEKAKLVERDDIAPKFWWRDMPEKFPDENAKMSDEKKKRLEKRRTRSAEVGQWRCLLSIFVRTQKAW